MGLYKYRAEEALYRYTLSNKLMQATKKDLRGSIEDKFRVYSIESEIGLRNLQDNMDEERFKYMRSITRSSISVLASLVVSENVHKQTGKHFIQVPKKTVKVIDSIKVDKVSANAVLHPYYSAIWDLPEDLFPMMKNRGVLASIISAGMRYEKLQALCPEHMVTAPEDLSERAMTILLEDPNKGKDSKLFTFVCLKMESFHQAITAGYEAFWRDVVIQAHGQISNPMITAADYQELLGFSEQDREDIYKIALFIYKTCIFIQAHPESLKPGTPQTMTVKARKKKKKITKKIKCPTHVFTLPAMYRKQGKAHYVTPHFRSLHDARYRRVDENGELLEVGEEGFVRIIAIKGHFKGGKMSHVDAEEIE
jgi:hypothetical protein